jgi:hypothetical protein
MLLPVPFAGLPPADDRLAFVREELEREVLFQARVWGESRDVRDLGRLEGAIDALGIVIRASE